MKVSRAPTTWRADGDLGVEDVLAAEHQRRSWVAGSAAHAYHMSSRLVYYAEALGM